MLLRREGMKQEVDSRRSGEKVGNSIGVATQNWSTEWVALLFDSDCTIRRQAPELCCERVTNSHLANQHR